MLIELALVFVASFLAALLLTPLVRKVAIRFDIVDKPDGRRKLHGRTIARAGGTAVLFSVLLVCSLAMFRYDPSVLSADYLTPFVTLLTVMVGIWLIGLADDVWTLRGRQKLLGQAVLALLLVVGGFQIGSMQIMGFKFDLGLLSIPASLIGSWLQQTHLISSTGPTDCAQHWAQ